MPTLGWKVADIASTIERLSAEGVQLERYGGLKQDGLGVRAATLGERRCVEGVAAQRLLAWTVRVRR